jgi:hypothetical protein
LCKRNECLKKKIASMNKAPYQLGFLPNITPTNFSFQNPVIAIYFKFQWIQNPISLTPQKYGEHVGTQWEHIGNVMGAWWEHIGSIMGAWWEHIWNNICILEIQPCAILLERKYHGSIWCMLHHLIGWAYHVCYLYLPILIPAPMRVRTYWMFGFIFMQHG